MTRANPKSTTATGVWGEGWRISYETLQDGCGARHRRISKKVIFPGSLLESWSPSHKQHQRHAVTLLRHSYPVFTELFRNPSPGKPRRWYFQRFAGAVCWKGITNGPQVRHFQRDGPGSKESTSARYIAMRRTFAVDEWPEEPKQQ